MKRLSLLIAIACLAMACGRKDVVKLRVFNPLGFERALETVEIPWDSLTMRLAGLTPDSVAVFNASGDEIPSQVTRDDAGAPQLLIFQSTIPERQHKEFTVRKAPRGQYEQQAFGRYVPERKDDYAWENNLVAYRIYGPALEEEMASPGIDVWCKRTPKLVIDRWYASADYHHDHGEGLDCYKVGVSLGGGASAPLSGYKLWLGRNWTSWKTLDNGPLRTTVRLEYAPFEVDERMVSLVKYISLDANTHFCKVTDLYSGDFARLDVAAGMPMHEGARSSQQENWIALTEPASDLQDPAAECDISIGVVMLGPTAAMQADGHWLIWRTIACGEPSVYWNGSGWSGAGMDDERWQAAMERQMQKAGNPLTVFYSR